MNLALFLLYTILGSLIWNTLLVGIGAVLGSSWHRIAEWIDVYSNIIYVILALIAIGVLVWLFRRKDHS
jgi:membrane protein DedA with SNARE-associated domain